MQEKVFTIRIATATPCKIVSCVSGVNFTPASLPGGPVELTIRVDALRRDTMLLGNVLLKTAFSKRWFVLNGQVAVSESAKAITETKAPNGFHPPVPFLRTLERNSNSREILIMINTLR